MPDYSQYVAVKKIRTAQTANANTSIVKGRAPYMYDGYFPLYRSVKLPVNALLSNKFNLPQGFIPPSNIFTRLKQPFDLERPNGGEPTNATFDGVDTIYASCYFETNQGAAIMKYVISTGVSSVFLTKGVGLTFSYGIAYDAVNSCIYHGNLAANNIQKIAISGGTPGTITNLITSGSLSSPYQIEFDGTNTLYVANTGNHTVSAINVTTGVSTVFAGADGTSGSVNGSRLSARFKSPIGVAYDKTTSSLYVADSGNFVIRKINLLTDQVTTIAGTVSTSGSFAEGIGSDARFGGMRAISVDTVGQRIFVTDEGNNVITQLDIATLRCTRIAGIVGQSGDDGKTSGDPRNSILNLPRGTVYASPYLYILDTRNNALKRITFT